MTASPIPARLDHADFPGPARLHYVRAGSRAGMPLLLLHGWPEFWLSWAPVMERLAGAGYDLVAPDFRGFGDSEKPDGDRPSAEVGPAVHAADMLALMDGLGLAKVGIVAHDVGSSVAQTLARDHPERVAGLFLFNCVHAGVGRRWVASSQIGEIWYQSLHQQPWAAALIGSSRDSCRTYLRHFLTHWAGRKDAFDDVLEEWVDNFLKPGNLQGGFNWYLSTHAARMRTIDGDLPKLPRIEVPTCVRWGERDPILRVDWADTLDQTFAQLDYRPLPGLGHFPHREDPDFAAAEIAAFFGALP